MGNKNITPESQREQENYNHQEIEQRWQTYWRENDTYKVKEDKGKEKFYVLDMFPYPSGAGLHVGHPLGYIASDIYSRYKRQQGFNVLHPMGYDAYGLPAEQYAIQTGQHPEKTTNENISRYREQLDKIGFSFDWSREVRTCDPNFYKWTQWAFLQMFNSYYDTKEEKALPISELVAHFEKEGTRNLHAAESKPLSFTAEEWKKFSEKEKSEVLMNYRIAYQGESMVNWCEKLGTVLANDEVSEGLSVRGGFPVEQKVMTQWLLRVSAYSQRLLDGLDTVEWSDSLKETQKNWIGRSEGAEMRFPVEEKDLDIEIFTTRADTSFGVTFMVLAPESKYVEMVVTDEQRPEVDKYLEEVSKKTERERQIDKRVSGVFSGSYAKNPITGERIPIWISDYVLAGYGTGAIMAVPAHDSRDYAFAKHFELPIIPLIEGADVSEESFDAKEGIMINSANDKLNLNGLTVKEAITATKEFIEKEGIGHVKVNYRLRDAIFSRQRYWGEPFPIYYKDGIATGMEYDKLPLRLPEVESYLPTSAGEPPLGRAKNWKTPEGYQIELCTMPGFAGSSAYYLRYMDPHNNEELVSKEANSYWKDVDLYVGGSEHATGHLIYSRFWNKFLYDLGKVVKDEPFRKLVNQGMIQGRSNFVYRIKDTNTFVSKGLKDRYETTPIRVDIKLANNDVLDIERFRSWRPEFSDAEFILEDGKYICGSAVEKMSKSMFNVVNPDEIVEKYGADTLRLYEMFLGPIEQSKPWDTNGIDGSNRFLKKLWAHFRKALEAEEKPMTAEERKTMHKLIKKVTQDIETFSFNTSVAAFMVALNELGSQKSANKETMDLFTRVIAPFAPHIAEEFWHQLGHDGSVADAEWPEYNEEYLKEATVKYPVSFNGKTRFMLEVASDASKEEVEKCVMESPEASRWLEGKSPKKVIVVPGRIVNIVV
ncbi:MAG: leucine--tRNA ligase [Muribaculaceae bacterium]|nr:leucine--tRNA ligase [Muribaculaceae bacterium]